MGFELIYSLSLWLAFAATEHAVLRWLDKSDTDRIAKYLKLQSSAQYFIVGFAVVSLFWFGIPYVFGFELHSKGMLGGAVIYVGWAFAVGKSKWKSLKERVIQEKMEARGKPGARLADLRVRKVSDYIPTWLLALPYLLLLAVGLFLVLWGGPSVPSTSNLLFLALGAGLILFLTTRMTALVREPMDLRSATPKDFMPKVHTFLKSRIRLLLVFQVAYVLSLLASVVGSSSYLLSPIWVFAFQIPFVISALWFSISTNSGIVKLDEQRWLEELQEPSRDT